MNDELTRNKAKSKHVPKYGDGVIFGFRQSLQYQEWKRLLHHFYDPFPVVEHYKPTDIHG